MFALGKPVESITANLAQKWAGLGDHERVETELVDRGRSALMTGHFAAAVVHAAALRTRVASRPDVQTHGHYTRILVDAYLETGQAAAAGQAAADYLRRRDAWLTSSTIDADTVYLYSVLRDTGGVSGPEFAARRAEWVALHDRVTGGSKPVLVWLEAWARPATRRDDAIAALAAVDRHALDDLRLSLVGSATVGRLLWLAGRPAEAAPYLRRAAEGCDGFENPRLHVGAAWLLGQALEATGDVAGACTAYQRVMTRWGRAQPASQTAVAAERRMLALGCR
jgi:hypothetical protein